MSVTAIRSSPLKPDVLAALNSIEPFVMNVALIDLFYGERGMGEAAPPGRGGVWAGAPDSPCVVA